MPLANGVAVAGAALPIAAAKAHAKAKAAPKAQPRGRRFVFQTEAFVFGRRFGQRDPNQPIPPRLLRDLDARSTICFHGVGVYSDALIDECVEFFMTCQSEMKRHYLEVLFNYRPNLLQRVMAEYYVIFDAETRRLGRRIARGDALAVTPNGIVRG